MSDQVREAEYRYVIAQDKPGEGARIFAELAARGVNLTAVLGFPLGGGRSQVDLFPQDPAAFEAAAAEIGLELSAKKRALYVSGEDRPGVAAEYCKKLGEAGINITALMATASGSSFGMVIWVEPEDFERAKAAIA